MVLGDRFALKARVGVGGSASVYCADDRARGDRAAVKVMHPNLVDQEELVDRFLREVELMRELSHPSIPRLRDASTPRDTLLWFATDFVEGETLAKRAAHGVTPAAMAVYALLVCDALRHLHAQGVIHRDVKPENVIVDPRDVAWLIDLGIARSPASITILGDQMGTPTFMPPEQALDPRDVDPRSDLYALGVTMFAVCTLRSGVELTCAATRASSLARLPEDFAALVERATERELDQRFPDALTMQDALANLIGDF
jgi:serine/threonine protein kinase